MTRSSSSLDAPPALTGGAAAAALPALADFDFPVAVVVSDLGADGSVRTILEAGEVDEVLPFASVTKPIVAWSALVAADRGPVSYKQLRAHETSTAISFAVGGV